MLVLCPKSEAGFRQTPAFRYFGLKKLGVIHFVMSANKYKNQKDIVSALEAFIDPSYDGLCICDHKRKVVRINSAAEKINVVKI